MPSPYDSSTSPRPSKGSSDWISPRSNLEPARSLDGKRSTVPLLCCSQSSRVDGEPRRSIVPPWIHGGSLLAFLARRKLFFGVDSFFSNAVRSDVPIRADGGVVLRGLCSHLTVAVLLAHAMLGCCWHHAHACGETHDHLAMSGWQHPSKGNDHHPAGGPDRAHHGHGRDDCHGAKCSFVISAKDGADSSLFASCLFCVLTLPPADRVSVGGVLEPQFPAAGSLLLPVRLHLLHQVLLI